MWGLEGIVGFKSFFLIAKVYQAMIPLPLSSSVPSFHLCVAAMQFFLLYGKTIACKCPYSIKHMEKYSALCFPLNECIWHVSINLEESWDISDG